MKMEKVKKSQTLREYLNKFNKLRKSKSNDKIDLTSFKEESNQVPSQTLVIEKLERIRQIVVNRVAFSKEDSDILGQLSDIIMILHSVFEKLRESEAVSSMHRMRSQLAQFQESIQENEKKSTKDLLSLKKIKHQGLPSPQILKKNSEFTDLGGSIRPSQIDIQYGKNVEKPEDAYYLPSFPLIKDEEALSVKKLKPRFSHRSSYKGNDANECLNDSYYEYRTRKNIDQSKIQVKA